MVPSRGLEPETLVTTAKHFTSDLMVLKYKFSARTDLILRFRIAFLEQTLLALLGQDSTMAVREIGMMNI